MKAIHLKCVTALAMSLSACACIPSVEEPVQTATPAPAPVAAPAPAPAATSAAVPVVQEPVFDNYLDAPQTPGTWVYEDQSNGGLALYSASDGSPLFMLECDRIDPGVMVFRETNGQGNRAASIVTETSTRSIAMQGRGPGHVAILNPNDPILDAMAITKGRIAIGVEGERTLYLPAWVEISRVIEDCR